jgi:hypothetical protein
MVEPFDGATMIPTVVLCKVLAWIQIHKVPPLFGNKEVLTQLASRAGEVVVVELVAVQTCHGEYHRARVRLDPTRPLVRIVSLAPEGIARTFLPIKYEKMS